MAMLKGIAEMGLKALPWTDGANSFCAQVQFLKRLFPEEAWPDLSDEALAQNLDEWLKPYLAGISRKSHLERLDLLAILKDLVPHDLQRQMDGLAPRRIEVPSGAHVAIDYETEGDPVIRVRLQEMFGLAKTPTIAKGRAQFRIELLSPAGGRWLSPSLWRRSGPMVIRMCGPNCGGDIRSIPGRKTRSPHHR